MADMPGPQFNQDNEPEGWMRTSGQKIVIGAIVILLIIGGYYFYKSYQQRTALLRPDLENNQEQIANGQNPSPTPTANTQPAVLGEKQASAPAVPEVMRKNSDLVAQAAKGNGATHLARQSLKEYLKDKKSVSDSLKAEQRIYIEDYLQKHATKLNKLMVGDQIAFSDSLMKDAIDQAQKLTDKQINNLHKYVLLVPSLMNT